MIKIEVQGARATCTQLQTLTAGMVGAEVEFSFDEEWDGLTKLAVFETDNCKEITSVPDSGTLVIPKEVLTYPGFQLRIGVIGKTVDGAMVIPTVYADCDAIKTGASTVPVGTPPTPSQAEQLQAQIDALANISGDGLSAAEKTLLLSLFKNAAYTADMSATIEQLKTLWSGGDAPDEPVGPDEPDVPIGGDIAATGDEDVTVTGATATDDGDGSITVIGATAADDDNGNITVS